MLPEDSGREGGHDFSIMRESYIFFTIPSFSYWITKYKWVDVIGTQLWQKSWCFCILIIGYWILDNGYALDLMSPHININLMFNLSGRTISGYKL